MFKKYLLAGTHNFASKKKKKRKLKDKGSPQGARFAAGVSPRVCAASTGSSSSFPIRSLRQIVVAFHPVQDRFGFLDTVSAIGQFLSWRSVSAIGQFLSWRSVT